MQLWDLAKQPLWGSCLPVWCWSIKSTCGQWRKEGGRDTGRKGQPGAMHSASPQQWTGFQASCHCFPISSGGEAGVLSKELRAHWPKTRRSWRRIQGKVEELWVWHTKGLSQKISNSVPWATKTPALPFQASQAKWLLFYPPSRIQRCALRHPAWEHAEKEIMGNGSV